MNRLLPAGTTALALAAGLTLSAPAARADIPFAPTVSIGPTVGTLGVGVEAGVRVGRWFGVRADWRGFPYETERGIGDVDYDVDATLSSFGATADLYLLLGLRLSAGLRLNDNGADIVGVPSGPIRIGGTIYQPAEVGRLDGTVSFDDTAPYLGIGYTGGLPFLGLDLVLDVGVLRQGSPRVTLGATGPVTALPGFAAELERERREVEDDLDFLDWYPVVSVGLVYRF